MGMLHLVDIRVAKKGATNYTNIEKTSTVISCMSGMEISLGPFQNRSPNT